MHVDAQAEGAVIDADQLIVGEETLTDGVDHLFGRDREELPLTNIPDALDLRGGGLNLVVGTNLDIVALQDALNPEENRDNSDDYNCTYDDINLLHNSNLQSGLSLDTCDGNPSPYGRRW